MPVDLTSLNWGALLAILAVVLVGWAVLKLAARVALTLIVIVLIGFAAFEFGLFPTA